MRAKPGPSWAVYEMPGNLKVASGGANSVDDAEREAGHYAMQYGQDGTVRVVVRNHGRIVWSYLMSVRAA